MAKASNRLPSPNFNLQTEVTMTKTLFRVFAAMAVVLTGSQALQAQGTQGIQGTWDVNVTVVNCQTGAAIRTVRSLQMFSHDGSFTETANTFLRGSSLGEWDHTTANGYTTSYWFFRYNADGSFKSLAEASNNEQVSDDGTTFTATGTVTDYDAAGNVISTGCVSHAARRLTPHN
jgi:hypothetical protein